VVASTEDIFPAYNAGFREGIGFSASDVASGNRCMVLGSRLAQRLFGDSSALGKEIIWHNEWIESPTGEIEPAPSGYVYTVIGVMEPVESSIMAKAAAELEDDPERFDFSIDGRAYIPITSAPGMEGPQSQSLRNQCRISLIERCCTCLDEVRQAIDIEYDGRLEASSAMEHMKENMRQLRSLAAAYSCWHRAGAGHSIDQYSQLDARKGIAANAGDRNLGGPGRQQAAGFPSEPGRGAGAGDIRRRIGPPAFIRPCQADVRHHGGSRCFGGPYRCSGRGPVLYCRKRDLRTLPAYLWWPA